MPVCFLPGREEVFDGVVLEEKPHVQQVVSPPLIEQDGSCSPSCSTDRGFHSPAARGLHESEESPTAALLAPSPAARCHLSSHSGLCSGQYHVFPKNYESGRDNSRLCAACLPLPSHLLVIQPSSCLHVRICLLSLKQKADWFLVVRTGCKH